ncbi:DUF732 domain-containing protein [Mycobacterium shigaense]|nr:DUF732 domain-containing protein [Mycobacterium shigaense]
MTSDDESAPTTAGKGPSDETELVPPVTQAAQEYAWSLDDGTDFEPPSWRRTAAIAAAVVMVCTAAAASTLLIWRQHRDNIAQRENHAIPTIVTTTPTPAGASQPPGTDDRGWIAYPGARCEPGNRPAVMARTTHSVVVVCEIQPGNFYYRGVRLSDGASIELPNAVRSSQGFDITNPADGTVYRIRPTSLTIAPSDGPASTEPMLQYVFSLASAPATTPLAAPNIAPSAAALPPIPATSAPPTAKDPNDDEFVAMALSPQAHNGAGGFGISGTQEQANQIALNHCRQSSGNDDCLLINAGMFHGCVAYALDRADPTRWSSGSGPDSDAAKAAATRRLDNPGFLAVQCSDPPGIIKNPTVNVLPMPAPPSGAELDQRYLAALNAGGVAISDVGLALHGAHEICASLADGRTKGAIEADIVASNHTLTVGNAATVVNSAVAVYCPQYGG